MKNKRTDLVFVIERRRVISCSSNAVIHGGGSAQAAEKQQEVGTPETASAQSMGIKTHTRLKGTSSIN